MNFAVVNEGKYPTKPSFFSSKREMWAFGGMTLYIVGCVFYVLAYYTWGGGQ